MNDFVFRALGVRRKVADLNVSLQSVDSYRVMRLVYNW